MQNDNDFTLSRIEFFRRDEFSELLLTMILGAPGATNILVVQHAIVFRQRITLNSPTVTISAVFEVGQRDEPAGKAGLANLTVGLLGEATQKRSAAEFSDALDRIGARLSMSPYSEAGSRPFSADSRSW